MKFYNDASILVAVDGDACAYWSKDNSAWEMGGVAWARECWLDLNSISKAKAKKQFPDADFASIPDLGEAKAKAEEGYDKSGMGSKSNDNAVTEVGKSDDLASYATKSDAGELKKVYVNPDRKKAAKIQSRLKAQLGRYLRAIGKDIAAQVRDKLPSMEKADEPDFDVEGFIAGLNFDMFEEMEDDLAAALRDVHGDSGRIAIAQMGVRDRSQLVNQVNERAVSWAKEHAADLVGRSKNPQYALTDSTRDMIRSTIATGMAENLSNLEIAEALEDAYAFSPERAEVIAMTEIASANSQGALDGYREAADIGVTVRKSWLMLEDACPICEENADNGIIELDEEFPSGDMTPPGHPNCRCVLVPEVEGGGEEAEEIEGDEDAVEE